MSWRVRPDDVLLEVGRLYGSKVGLQKLNTEVRILPSWIEVFFLFTHIPFFLLLLCVHLEYILTAGWHSLWTSIDSQLHFPVTGTGLHDHWHLSGRTGSHQKGAQEEGRHYLYPTLGN